MESLKIVRTLEPEQSQEVQPVEEVEQAYGSPEVEAPSFADLFGMEPTNVNDRDRSKLADIVDWARSEFPDLPRHELRWAIVQKKNSLGAPRVGETTLAKLHRWVVAYRGFRSAEAELKAMEGV